MTIFQFNVIVIIHVVDADDAAVLVQELFGEIRTDESRGSDDQVDVIRIEKIVVPV